MPIEDFIQEIRREPTLVIGVGGNSQDGPEAVVISTLLYQELAKHATLGNQASVTVDVRPRKPTRKERKERARQRELQATQHQRAVKEARHLEHQRHVARKKARLKRSTGVVGLP